MSQATTTYAAVQTLPDGGTMVDLVVQAGESEIFMIGSVVVIDGAWTVDTGNNFTLRLTGKGLVDGDQELNVGVLKCDETGTSVTGTLTSAPAFYQPVSIRVRAGHINLSAAYDGTDPGTPFLAVTFCIR